MPSIVTVNVSQTVAPTPANLQQKGAIVSQGATTLAAGTLALLTQQSDATPLIKSPIAISTMVYSGGTVTLTAAAPHGIAVGDGTSIIIVGAVPAGYNGLQVATATSPTVLTFALGTSPGTVTTPGTFFPEDYNEFNQQLTTFFAQGAAQSVYVLELGEGNATDGVTALTTWLTANPLTIYAFLIPRTWDQLGNGALGSLLTAYNGLTAKTYFHVTSTSTTYTQYLATQKSAIVTVEAPAVGANEFSAAALFYKQLAQRPSNTNRLTPFAFSFLYGVTPYPTVGTGVPALLTALKAGAINYIGTGAEGGISNTISLWGTTMDGRDLSYWYAVDWLQINLDLNLSNAIINGSNNPINPLYFNQQGIDRLEGVVANTLSSAVTFGMVTGTVVQQAFDSPTLTTYLASGQATDLAIVNAIPFVPYTEANTGDYKIGRYAGLSCIAIPSRGFESIVFNLNVTDFIAQ